MFQVLLLSLFSLAQVAFSFNCSIPPIYVDIHKRAVHDSELFQYGAFIGLGTPGQNQSMWPSFEHNETTFAGLGFCTLDSPLDCGNDTHGFFQPDRSKSWQDVPNYQPFDSGDNTSVSVQYGEDTMYLYTHYFESDPATATTCHDFPSSILSNSTSAKSSFFGPAGRLGLGAYSTNLEQLFANNVISSRSFGLYLGTGYDRAGGDINGSLTYGGYDSGRMTGQVHNYTMSLPLSSSTQSPLQVRVSQISLEFNDGGGLRNLPLVNSSGFDAQISTSQYPLSLPHFVTSAFASALSASPANNSDNSLQLARPFNGNLTITLSDGFSVTFPPDWISNTSSHLTPISASSLSNPTDEPFILGSAFLAQVYLSLNYDSTPPTFHLAQAILKNAYVMPQPQCPNIAPVPYIQPPINHFVAAGLVGAILGGLIGGCAITALIWVCVRSYCAKRGRAKQVRFAVESKVLELEEYREEVVKQGFTVVATPVTPGWPLSNEMAERQPLSPQYESVIDGKAGRMRVTTVFDPPPKRSWTVQGQDGDGGMGRKKRMGRH